MIDLISGMARHVICPKCGRRGTLTRKPTKTGRYTYVYWYVRHSKPPIWCYIGKDLPESLRAFLGTDDTNRTEISSEIKNPDQGFLSSNSLNYLGGAGRIRTSDIRVSAPKPPHPPIGVGKPKSVLEPDVIPG